MPSACPAFRLGGILLRGGCLAGFVTKAVDKVLSVSYLFDVKIDRRKAEENTNRSTVFTDFFYAYFWGMVKVVNSSLGEP